MQTLLLSGLGLTLGWFVLHRRRIALYRRLARQQSALIERHGDAGSALPETVPDFGQRLAVIDDLLPPERFARLRARAERLGRIERSYLPGHKQGGTIAYEHLHRVAPELVGFYLSPGLRALCERIVGEPLQPTPLHDQSSCSLLIYDRPRDHIGWHYDHNFYRGRHFTALFSLINEGPGGLASARLQVRQPGDDRDIATPPNTLVLFEGATVRHRVTRLGAGEKRIVLSMTFATDAREPRLKGAARRLKDTAYFGVRALWT